MRAALIALALAGCVAPPEHEPSAWPVSRAELERSIPTDDPDEASYRTYCLSCHGVDGRGAGGVTGADFTSPAGPLARPDAELLVSIRMGRSGAIGLMPAHGAILGDERSAGVLAYVRRAFGPDIVPVEPVPGTVDPAAAGGVEVDDTP